MLVQLVPTYDEKYTHQTELSSVTEEEFNANIKPSKATVVDRLIQLVFFFVFFGWLRLLLIIFFSLVYVILMSPVLITPNPTVIKIMTAPGIALTRLYFRVVYFLLGIYYIKREGEIDPKARCFLFNHQTVLDGPMIYIYKPFIVIGMAELKRTPVAGPILTAAKSLFVDRSKNEGIAKVITDYLNEPQEVPMALSPEGRTTKGKFLLQFRTGSFIAKAPIQPVTIRYKVFLPFGKTGVVWLVGGMKEWLIRMLCMPGAMVEMHFLPLLDNDEFYNKSPAEKALYCNLLMANDLGVKASDRSTRDMFKKGDKKKDEKKQKEE
ncbi:Acyltransferase family protein [Tritrichomonas foetus]|uniref:Acyltransferase family protein n=1 Tax=Tritrichomonas foetus TaxID=1144522 RepID=A0A1J4JBP1_9EUKA|nr:Acyltransferase family protein [Tritrichomonas foetus]|eukprot:OHS96598.1 Acyltransferase family protein [Tritrichomonas foetus]